MKHSVKTFSAVLFAGAVYSALALLYEPGPIDKYSRTVVPPIIGGGEILTVTSTVVRSKPCASTIYRRFVDASGRAVEFDPLFMQKIPAGTETFQAKITVPLGLTPGPMIYQVKVNFHCNWLQDWFGGSWFILPDVNLKYVDRAAE